MFKGKTITLVVPYSPGGGYDTYARLIAPYLGEELGAKVVVRNKEGAGGLLAINNLIAAEPDGTHIAIMNGVGVAGGAIAEAEGVQFELKDLSMIGRVASQTPVFVVGAKSDYQTLEDVKKAKNFEFASTGPGAADFVNASLLIQIFDLDARLVTGFEGSDESELAVIRGDVDGQTGDLDSRLPAIENQDERPLLLVDDQRAEQLPETPALLKQDLTKRQRGIAEPLVSLSAVGRAIVGPPEMPEDRLGCLRDALHRSMQDPKMMQKSKKIERPLDWLSGTELDKLIGQLLDSSPEFQKSMREAYNR